ncbi:MAG: DUF1178 family protein [Brevundimonas sp.]|jgi:hypothetical protein|uniref:DUF1178 family protein n=1 Tax=Brevundimonas sp. TaxID=1871086 RepID=UPI00391D6F7D
MIRYALQCDFEHRFEAWFSSSSDYDGQRARGLVECPVCGSRAVSKQIMAPAVSGTKRTAADPDPEAAGRIRKMMMQAVREVRSHVEANFDYVGDAFAREAREIHEGRCERREIYGEATPEEVRALREDGVPCAPLPSVPPEPEQLN